MPRRVPAVETVAQMPYRGPHTKNIAGELAEGVESMLLRKYTWTGVVAVFLFVAASQVALCAERGFTILAVNDVYRIAGVDEGRRGGIARTEGVDRGGDEPGARIRRDRHQPLS